VKTEQHIRSSDSRGNILTCMVVREGRLYRCFVCAGPANTSVTSKPASENAEEEATK
jgi:hypothetical protein